MLSNYDSLFHRLQCQARDTRMRLYRRWREPKLYKCAQRLDYGAVRERCIRLSPQQASREARFQPDYGEQKTALHSIVTPLLFIGDSNDDDNLNNDGFSWDTLIEMRHAAVVALLDVCPGAAMQACHFGTLPLAMVCLDPHGSLLDVDALIEAAPECVGVADHAGQYPLHYACLTNCANEAMIQRLLRKDGTSAQRQVAASLPDHLGRLPLHYAVGAESALAHYPETRDIAQQLQRECDGAPPVTPRALQLLLDAAADSAGTKDEDDHGSNSNGTSARDKFGLYPLHYFCRRLLKLLDTTAAIIIMEQLQVLKMLLQAGDPSLITVPYEQQNEATTTTTTTDTPLDFLRQCLGKLTDDESCTALLRDCLASYDMTGSQE